MRENEPFKFVERTFSELQTHSREWKSEFQARTFSTQNFSKITLAKTRPDELFLFAISSAPTGSVQTLQRAFIPLELTDTMKESDPKLEIKLKPAYNSELMGRAQAPSAEFSLLCERQRSHVASGVTDFETNNKGHPFVMIAGDQLFKYDSSRNTAWRLQIGESPEPMEVSSEGTGSRGCSLEIPENEMGSSLTKNGASTEKPEPTTNFVAGARTCPCDEKYLAYVLNKQVYIEYNGRVVFHTTSTSKHITNGVPSYIVQEELERFNGIWWSETHPRLLYENVNEEAVENANFTVNGEASVNPMKYPRAGKTNASSTLRMVIFENDKCYDVALKEGVLARVAPQFEYITRAGFFSDGVTVWVQVMNRNQSECTLILVPITDFELPPELRDPLPTHDDVQLSTDLNMGHWSSTSHEEAMEKPPPGKLRNTVAIHRARTEYWINTHNAIHPLKVQNPEQPLYEFIYCLEKPRGSCLALLSAELDQNGWCRHTEEKLLMAETHSINKTVNIKVDEKRELVYYVANYSHATEWNVCVAHYRSKELNFRNLTEATICFKTERAHMQLALDFDHGFACWMTSVGSPALCRFYAFRWSVNDRLPTSMHSSNITLAHVPMPAEVNVDAPEMVEYQSKRTGLIHYGMIIRPPNFDPSKKYPVFHYVYGGPGIQIVHNDFTWIQWSRFSRLGYVVVMLDNRGTAHRGIEFERHIHLKMGAAEVEDQVEGLQMMADRVNFMDMDRVVVHGWSYGGYMALNMIAAHPNIYRAAIAGGAVSDWKLYDTAYTERYLGYPVEEHVYQNSSVLRFVHKLPDEPGRLMLIHGLMDENVHFAHLKEIIDSCTKNGKWHELVLFPNERHGIRNTDSSVYLDARMMYFAQRAICDPGTIPRPPKRSPSPHAS